MFKTFKVKNFKNFKEQVVLDFGKVGGYKFSQDCITTNFRDMNFWGDADYSYVNADALDKEVSFEF